LPKQRNSDKPLPVTVYIHGGGWVNGDRASYLGQATRQVATGNYAAVAVGYRLSNEVKWPAQIHDCKAAIRWIRGHAKELNIDPARISVQGTSAGGHLVSMLGVTGGVKELEGDIGEFPKESSAVTCVINYCGPSDLTVPLIPGSDISKPDAAVSGLIGGTLQEKMAVAKEASPLTYVSKSAVPFMTVHGTNVGRVNFNNAQKLDEALKKAGVSSILIPITDGGHSIHGGPELEKRLQQFNDLHLRGIQSEIATTPIPNQAPATPPKK
jgi:acetyl esterase/lipase